MHKWLRLFGTRISLEKFQSPTLFNAHGQSIGLILEFCCPVKYIKSLQSVCLRGIQAFLFYGDLYFSYK